MIRFCEQTRLTMGVLVATCALAATLFLPPWRRSPADDKKSSDQLVLRAVGEDVDANMTVVVEYAGISKSVDKCWISIAKKGAPADEYVYWSWASGTDGVLRFPPLRTGEYEARLFQDWPHGGHEIWQRCPIRIAAATGPAEPPPPSPAVAMPALRFVRRVEGEFWEASVLIGGETFFVEAKFPANPPTEQVTVQLAGKDGSPLVVKLLPIDDERKHYRSAPITLRPKSE